MAVGIIETWRLDSVSLATIPQHRTIAHLKDAEILGPAADDTFPKTY